MFSFSGCSSDDDNSENPDMIGKWEEMEVSAKDANIEKKVLMTIFMSLQTEVASPCK